MAKLIKVGDCTINCDQVAYIKYSLSDGSLTIYFALAFDNSKFASKVFWSDDADALRRYFEGEAEIVSVKHLTHKS
jgi:hypothetical protein